MLKREKKHHIQLAFACEGGGVGETLSKREKTPPLVSGKSNRKIRKEYGHSSTGYCDHIQHTWWVFHCMDLPSQFPPSTRTWQCHCGCCSSWGSSMICLAWCGHIETFDHVCNGQGGSNEVLKVNVQRPRNNVPCLLGQLYESSTVPQCHLLAAGAHHVGAPAQHKLHMDSCCLPELSQATAWTVATTQVDRTCWGWKECGGGQGHGQQWKSGHMMFPSLGNWISHTIRLKTAM